MTYIDNLTSAIGRWQIASVCLASITVMNLAHSHLEITFFAPKQNHTCQDFPLNISHKTLRTLSEVNNDDSCDIEYIVAEDGLAIVLSNKKDPARINLTAEYNNSEIMEHECGSWSYDKSIWQRTIIEDFELVCHRDVLISTSSFAYMAGMMLGVSVFGQMADKFGRRRIASICTIAWLIVSIVTAFSVNYIMFVVMRFIMAAVAAGAMTITYVWAMECMNSKGRGIGGTIISIIWCVGMLATTVIPYLTKDWLYSQLAYAGLIALCFPLYWFTVESPSWLFSVGKFKEGMTALTAAAKMNGRLEPVEDFIRADLDNKFQGSEEKSVTLWDVMRHYPYLRTKILIIYYNWFVVSFVYFALTLNTGDLGGDIFINMTIASILEAIGYLLAIALLVRIGRCLPTAMSFIIGGICCFIVAFLPTHSPGFLWSSVTVALVGRTAISIAFNNLFVYTSELCPTVVRSVGLGSSSMVARVSGMLAPYVKELGKHTNSSVPMLLFAVLSTTAGAACFFLPETRDKTLPNSLEEGELFGKDPNDPQKRRAVFERIRKTLSPSKTSSGNAVPMKDLA